MLPLDVALKLGIQPLTYAVLVATSTSAPPKCSTIGPQQLNALEIWN
jgi:hypothetical protein